jgi:hypothetical protein
MAWPLEAKGGQAVALSVSSNNKWEDLMAVNVHGGAELGRILLYIAGFVGFVIVALTWVPEWISPDSANITGSTGSTSRMIQ